MESNSRSFAKAVSYRLLGSGATGLIALVFTHKPWVSGGIAAADMFSKVGLYFLHERIWEHIQFGRAKPPEYEI
ncbi:MAG TPA: DUF2061 domain-containing protein [Bryobacteraceae bacterium]|nr:DUF2061 domain-containing protein [Bryobacteraceae bacterium]